MKSYRRLTERARKKLEFYSKSKKILTKTSKWLIIIASIILLLIISIISFCVTLYNNKSKFNQENSNNNYNNIKNTFDNSQDLENTNNFTELEQKELERESQKQENLSESQNKNNINNNKNSNNINFYDFSEWNKTCAPELIVINSGNKLENINIKTKICRGKEVNILLFDDLENMIENAKKDNIILWISSGYRNISLQTKLFNNQVEREKSRELISDEEAQNRASKVVARPYTSEHNTGLAIDFNGVEDNFYKTPEYKWLKENAHKYGFIERYQEKFQDITGVIYEPWHFRYVGKEHAPKIKEQNICLEEYIKKIL